MRFWPKSLLGQMLLAIALALLVAQTISALLLYHAAQSRRDNSMLHTAAMQLIRYNEKEMGRVSSSRKDNADTPTLPRMRRDRDTDRGWDRGGQRGIAPPHGRPVRLPRRQRIEWTETAPKRDADIHDAARENELRALLEMQGVPIAEFYLAERQLADDPFLNAHPGLIRLITRRNGGLPDKLLVAALKRDAQGQWATVRVPEPSIQKGAIGTIIFQTMLIYLALVGLHFLLLRRITQPLATLTNRTDRFARSGEAGAPLPPQGPDDIQHLIRAHNAMEARIAALIDEKDVMLGAIGHDLKTPLAALRVRIESVEDDAEREKMAAGIEDITQTLDDILTLARVGRSDVPPERTDMAALTINVVEEFEDMGEPVVAGTLDSITHAVYVTWLRRALRNLISNAVRYGGEATVTLKREDGVHILRVEDNGPGIPEDQIAAMQEPFARGETSRNRDTGGAGLGLTLVRAIAEQHDGTLALTNRPQGGLRAEIRLPADEA